jgi:hypothetical protein
LDRSPEISGHWPNTLTDVADPFVCFFADFWAALKAESRNAGGD